MGRMRIEPVQLQKGDTKVALYGLGNVRDERLAARVHHPRGRRLVRHDTILGFESAHRLLPVPILHYFSAPGMPRSVFLCHLQLQ